jgi:hypothetical protein
MSDDHSEVVPLLPIPNRTVKRFRANDSAGSRVKVGHRQTIQQETPSPMTGRFFIGDAFCPRKCCGFDILSTALGISGPM